MPGEPDGMPLRHRIIAMVTTNIARPESLPKRQGGRWTAPIRGQESQPGRYVARRFAASPYGLRLLLDRLSLVRKALRKLLPPPTRGEKSPCRIFAPDRPQFDKKALVGSHERPPTPTPGKNLFNMQHCICAIPWPTGTQHQPPPREILGKITIREKTP